MSENCDRRNPLTRNGSHQSERYLPSLNPDFIQMDERSTSDLIRFTDRYSRQLKYYNSANTPDGDWHPFFATDITAVLAALNTLPVGSFQAFARGLKDYLSDDPSRADSDLSAHFKLLFHLPLMLLMEVGRYTERLPRRHSLGIWIEKLLQQDVKDPLSSLVSFYKGGLALADPPLNDTPLYADAALDATDYNVSLDPIDTRIQVPTAVSGRFAGAALSDLNLGTPIMGAISGSDWPTYYHGAAADTTPYEDGLGDLYVQIYDALNYNLLSGTFERLFQALERITLEAGVYLRKSLTDLDDHTPHYGLWLATLRLFKFNQSHLNRMTKRHLDFYYRDVLRLCRQQAEPDKVHLLFELAKNQETHLLEAGTLFKAGKDTLGKDASYQLDEDIVVNQAKVTSLMSIYRPSFELVGEKYFVPYAASVTNSRDGQREDLPEESPQWKPFGPTTGLTTARVGFALADEQLFLREGQRTVTITISLTTPLSVTPFPPTLTAALTTEDGWLEISDPAKLEIDVSDPPLLSLSIRLDGEDPPIVHYDSEVHGEKFPVDKPILKIGFNFDAALGADLAAGIYFMALKDLQFDAIDLQVSAQDVRDFTLQNEFGIVDTAKPFLPFGPMPEANAPLILGSSEIFSKQLDQISVKFEWEKAINSTAYFHDDATSSFKVFTMHLANGIWQHFGSDKTLFTAGQTTSAINLTGLNVLSDSLPQSLVNEPYSTQSSSGYIKFILNKGFGHGAYIDAKTLALIDQANQVDTPFPDEPYTPKITGIKLNYTGAVSQSADFFHLHPFGFTVEQIGGGRLFPELLNEGELFIGIGDLDPPQRLSLLFQTLPGTANPLKNENSLIWAYLRGDEWKELDEQSVGDKTKNLTGSGVIGLAIPEGADTAHQVIPSDMHWLRMSVEKDADALNDLLSVDAQAATATFLDQGNDPAFVDTPLAAGTIAKLTISQGEIKKVTQPYASFGGRAQESDDHFYVRASERLRHKDRASTMWDYERLVLEHFPKVYKVKCLNHTKLHRDAEKNILADNEVSPGHVVLVPIPYLKGIKSVDPLRPYTDKNTIIEIDRFLRTRLSPFVHLEVQNPKIEEVQVKFKVAFREEIADITFYKQELNQAIIRHLSPWAFDEGTEISFGGRWHKSAIINFVEEQSYVDYLSDFEMYHKVDIEQSKSDWDKVDEEVVQATTSRSVLVSHSSHVIEEII